MGSPAIRLIDRQSRTVNSHMDTSGLTRYGWSLLMTRQEIRQSLQAMEHANSESEFDSTQGVALFCRPVNDVSGI